MNITNEYTDIKKNENGYLVQAIIECQVKIDRVE